MGKKRFVAAAIAAGVMCAAGAASADDHGQQAMPPEMAEAMQAWMKLATPGDAHKVLDQNVGEWDVVVKWWLGGPDAPPTESKGTSKVQWILGGRFVEETFKGDMMGEPFEGRGTTGYDNARKLYVGTWIDSTSTVLTPMSGTLSADGKTLVMFGTMDDPTTGQYGKVIQYIVRFTDTGHTFEMWDFGAGAGVKVGEMAYTKKKGGKKK